MFKHTMLSRSVLLMLCAVAAQLPSSAALPTGTTGQIQMHSELNTTGTDIGLVGPGATCPYENDGECDEHEECPSGTDLDDCDAIETDFGSSRRRVQTGASLLEGLVLFVVYSVLFAVFVAAPTWAVRRTAEECCECCEDCYECECCCCESPVAPEPEGDCCDCECCEDCYECWCEDCCYPPCCCCEDLCEDPCEDCVAQATPSFDPDWQLLFKYLFGMLWAAMVGAGAYALTEGDTLATIGSFFLTLFSVICTLLVEGAALAAGAAVPPYPIGMECMLSMMEAAMAGLTEASAMAAVELETMLGLESGSLDFLVEGLEDFLEQELEDQMERAEDKAEKWAKKKLAITAGLCCTTANISIDTHYASFRLFVAAKGASRKFAKDIEQDISELTGHNVRVVGIVPDTHNELAPEVQASIASGECSHLKPGDTTAVVVKLMIVGTADPSMFTDHNLHGDYHINLGTVAQDEDLHKHGIVVNQYHSAHPGFYNVNIHTFSFPSYDDLLGGVETWVEGKIEAKMEQLQDMDTLVDELGDKLLEYGEPAPITVGDRILYTSSNEYDDNHKYDGQYGTVADTQRDYLIVDFEKTGRLKKSKKGIWCKRDDCTLIFAYSASEKRQAVADMFYGKMMAAGVHDHVEALQEKALNEHLQGEVGKTYTVVYKATVRNGADMQSTEVGKLKVGETVVAMREVYVDGHLRIQISEDRWSSIV